MSGTEVMGAIGSAAKGIGTGAGAVGGTLNGIAKGFGEGYRGILGDVYKSMGVSPPGYQGGTYPQGYEQGASPDKQQQPIGQQNNKMAIEDPSLMAHLQAGGSATSNPGYKDVSGVGSYEDLMKYIYGGSPNGRW